MSENNKATTESSNQTQDRDQEQPTKLGDQKSKIVKDDAIPDELTASPEQQHQQNESIIPQEETKMNINQQKQLADSLEEIRKSRAPLSASEQFDRFNYAEAKGVASRVAPYYWRLDPPALTKLNGMDRYKARPGWKSPSPSPSIGKKEDGGAMKRT